MHRGFTAAVSLASSIVRYGQLGIIPSVEKCFTLFAYVLNCSILNIMIRWFDVINCEAISEVAEYCDNSVISLWQFRLLKSIVI